jgi:hypothetical protein
VPHGEKPAEGIEKNVAIAEQQPELPRAATFFFGADPSRAYETLESAVDAARDGEVIVVRGSGVVATGPITIHGKRLHIKAEPGSRPRLERKRRSAGDWDALFCTDRELTLEGVDLAVSRDGKSDSEITHLVYSQSAPVHLLDCRLIAPQGTALIVCRDARQLELRDCVIESRASAVCVEVGGNCVPAVSLTNCRVETSDQRGAAICVWTEADRPSSPVRLHLEANRIRAGRVLGLGSLARGIDITARNNLFRFEDSLLSYSGSGRLGVWRYVSHWKGEHNRYEGSADWLAIENAAGDVRGLEAWREFWHCPEVGSTEARFLVRND